MVWVEADKVGGAGTPFLRRLSCFALRSSPPLRIQGCLLLQLALHQFFYSLQDLVFGQLGGIKKQRVAGGDQRRSCAGAIAAIAFAEFGGQGLGGGAWRNLL